MIFLGIKYCYQTMLFSTPFIMCSMLFSLLYIFVVKPRETATLQPLPPYPKLAARESLFLVVGELHHPKRPEPAEEPRWLTIPDRGLYTGIAIFGAIGSGKTSCCMYPFAEQVLAYKAGDDQKRPAGLVLEVKGDFCRKVRKILNDHGRAGDYFEISLDCPYRYNPLHNDMEAYALAYGIASLLNNLFGRGKEPFWQQAYTNLVKFIILLHKVNYDYLTLFDVYECAINPDKLEMKIKEGERLYQTEEYVLVRDAEFVVHRDRGSHFFVTPKAGEPVDKSRWTQVGRALRELNVEMMAAYSPQARGRSERNFGTWQNRLPQELRLSGIGEIALAPSRSTKRAERAPLPFPFTRRSNVAHHHGEHLLMYINPGYLRVPTKKITHSELKTITASPGDAVGIIVEQLIVMGQEESGDTVSIISFLWFLRRLLAQSLREHATGHPSF